MTESAREGSMTKPAPAGGGFLNSGPLGARLAGIDYKPDVAAAAASLVLSRLPMRFPKASGELAEWDVAGPAMVVRSSFTVRALHRMPPEDSMPPAEAVARSLIEQIITFAWLAAKPEERLVEWVGWLYTERIKSDNKFKKWLRGQGRDGDPLFSDDARTAAEEASGGKALDLGSRAVQADETWRPQITALGEKGCSFAEIYASAYTSYSYSTHALAQPLLRYTGAHPDGGVYIGPEGALGESTPWGVGLVVYLLGLLVSSRAVGWPDSDEVYKLLRSA